MSTKSDKASHFYSLIFVFVFVFLFECDIWLYEIPSWASGQLVLLFPPTMFFYGLRLRAYEVWGYVPTLMVSQVCRSMPGRNTYWWSGQCRYILYFITGWKQALLKLVEHFPYRLKWKPPPVSQNKNSASLRDYTVINIRHDLISVFIIPRFPDGRNNRLLANQVKKIGFVVVGFACTSADWQLITIFIIFSAYWTQFKCL